jgi:hypothetical protein
VERNPIEPGVLPRLVGSLARLHIVERVCRRSTKQKICARSAAPTQISSRKSRRTAVIGTFRHCQ